MLSAFVQLVFRHEHSYCTLTAEVFHKSLVYSIIVFLAHFMAINGAKYKNYSGKLYLLS